MLCLFKGLRMLFVACGHPARAGKRGGDRAAGRLNRLAGERLMPAA